MKRIITVASVIVLLGLSACAQQNGWTPTLDTTNDPHANRISTDLAQCKQLADKSANTNDNLLESGGIGAVGGAAGGALLGAMVGSPLTGAGLGAAAGTGIGLGAGGTSSDSTYRKVYSNCMRNRGHSVLD